MLQNLQHLYGKPLSALDGEIGHVSDFYFDDMSWMVRYLIVDTGNWLTGRKVLLTHNAFGPHAFGTGDDDPKTLKVNLTRKQISESPSIETHRPVSRQFEIDYYRFYGWPAYWEGGGIWGAAGFPVYPLENQTAAHHGHNQRDDIHLRSTKAVKDYHVRAVDGNLGSLSGFIVEGRTWAISELAIETGHWYSGKEVLVRPADVVRISYEEASVFVSLTIETLKSTLAHEVARSSS